MTEDLKPCPFCGREATLGWESDAAAIGRTKRRVFCGFCGIRTVQYENDAIKRWNTRASDPAVDALVKALEKCRDDARINHDKLPPTQVMGNLLGFIEDTADKALTSYCKQREEG